jgi:hypothetical protein
MLVFAFSLALSPAHAVGPNVLFVGNSYTQFNDPTALNQSYAALVAEGMPAWEVETQRYARGGQTLPMHLEEVTTTGTQLHNLLVADGAVDWDLVVIQDQSQIPGFPRDHAQYIESLDASVALAGIIEEAGAETRLFMTWGRKDGDSGNPDYYPDFPTMQALLTDGYESYATAIRAAGHPVEVIPVGLAFQAVYESHVEEGVSPIDGTLFARLFSGDGSHPSPTGTYLSALVFYTAFTGQSPVGLTWTPESVTPEDKVQLQLLVETLMADSIGEDEQEPDNEDSGTVTDPDEDTATADTPAEPSSEEDEDKSKGCSHSGGDANGGMLMFAVLLGMLYRRKTAFQH